MNTPIVASLDVAHYFSFDWIVTSQGTTHDCSDDIAWTLPTHAHLSNMHHHYKVREWRPTALDTWAGVEFLSNLHLFA